MGSLFGELKAREAAARVGSSAGAPSPEQHSFYAYDATFAEVAVDATLRLVRVRRMLGA